jgi:serine/threonine protein kinase
MENISIDFLICKNVYKGKFGGKIDCILKLTNRKEITYLTKTTNCKYFPKIYSHCITPNSRNYVSMEYINIVQPEYFAENLKELLIGLDFLHNNLKISHNDIKLENLGRRSDNSLVILDLGLASSFGPQKKIFGTIKTMPINMHLKKYVSENNDLESIVYELLLYKYPENYNYSFLSKKSHKEIGQEKLKLLQSLSSDNNDLAEMIKCILSNKFISYKDMANRINLKI